MSGGMEGWPRFDRSDHAQEEGQAKHGARCVITRSIGRIQPENPLGLNEGQAARARGGGG